MAAAILPMSLIKPGWVNRPFLFCPGERDFSISTTTACLTSSSPTATFIRKSTSRIGEPLGQSDRNCFAILTAPGFEEVPPATGSGLADVITARGAAFGDLFNDGHIDVVINNIDSTPSLLRNVVKNNNHWLTLKLVGGPRSPRDAIGAKVFVTAGGVRQRVDVFSGGSYSSSSDPRAHFGLGSATQIDKIEIQWPSGLKQLVAAARIDQIITIEEGKPAR